MREQTIKFLGEQLKKLHEEEHVDDLMKAGRIGKLRELGEELDFSQLDGYYEENEFLELDMEEIPEGCHYELIFYFTQYNEDNDRIFEDCTDVIEFFEEIPEELAKNIVDVMDMQELFLYSSLKDILFGI